MASNLDGTTPSEAVDQWNAWTEDERATWMQEAQVTTRPLTVRDLLTAAFPDWTADRVAEEAQAIESQGSAARREA